jgi:hypothetical protein
MLLRHMPSAEFNKKLNPRSIRMLEFLLSVSLRFLDVSEVFLDHFKDHFHISPTYILYLSSLARNCKSLGQTEAS